jgi:SAM-dependent methyltransferase
VTDADTRNRLKAASLLYRKPALYADLTDGVASDTAAVIIDLADRYGPPRARAVLDLGCGTGAVVSRVLRRYVVAVGVDVLPGMVSIGMDRHLGVDMRCGDMRTVRLGRRFDIVLCVGNALAYLTEPDDITAAFTTFATHSDRGSLLILQTLTTWPLLNHPRTTRTQLAGREATVTVTYTQDPDDETLIMTRHWNFDDNKHTTDIIRRRILTPDEQATYAGAAGFTPAGQPGIAPAGMSVFLGKEPSRG